MPLRYILGIDQGASKTHAILSDDQGNVLGLLREAGLVSGLPAVELLSRAVHRLLAQTGIALEQVDVLVAGLNGIDWPGDAQQQEQAIRDRLGIRQVQVVNDCIIALRAETAARYAAVICVGSGTNCAVRKDDQLFTYGFYIPDEHQGGMSLGYRAVQSVFDAEMGLLPETALSPAILEKLNAPTVDALLRRRAEGGLTPADYLSLPVTLERVALNGDSVALNIWREYGRILANYALARMKKMELLDAPVQVVLSGSIFKCRVEAFHQAVRDTLLSRAPKAVITPAVYEPIVGAVFMGLEAIHGYLPQSVDDNLRRSAKSHSISRFT